MNVRKFVELVGGDFYTGVPDSQLKALCGYLIHTYGVGKKHIIAANEGNAVGLAAGHYLSTGKIPVVYMQNSGLGNIINPYTSLLHNDVYGIPCIFVIGWRGEPGIHDEPQHIFQGKITLPLLDELGIKAYVIDNNTSELELEKQVCNFSKELERGNSVAYVIKKGSLYYEENICYENSYSLKREDVLKIITEYSKNDVIVSTTGKTSRELFEIRERVDKNHSRDFLTVGSMGHSSSIALKIALEKGNRRVWCIDGDGAMLMHMGAMATVGSIRPENLVHVVINNESHETVGGMPTAADKINLPDIAKACGYDKIESVKTLEELKNVLQSVKESRKLTFLEIKCAIGSRKDLGRPTTTPQENRNVFMKFLQD